jgi:hypothetical protein
MLAITGDTIILELTVDTCYKEGVMVSMRGRWRSSRRRRLVLDEGEVVGRDSAGRGRDWTRWRWSDSTIRRRGVRRDETAAWLDDQGSVV